MARAPEEQPVAPALPWRAEGDATRLAIRLTPRGGRDAIDGIVMLDDGRAVLAIRVRAVAEDGKANAALIAVLAEALGIPSRDITVVSGQASRVKIVSVAQRLGDIEARLRAIAAKNLDRLG